MDESIRLNQGGSKNIKINIVEYMIKMLSGYYQKTYHKIGKGMSEKGGFSSEGIKSVK